MVKHKKKSINDENNSLISSKDMLKFVMCNDEEDNEYGSESEIDYEELNNQLKEKNISDNEIERLNKIKDDDMKRDMGVLMTLKAFNKELQTNEEVDLEDIKDLMSELLIIVSVIFKQSLVKKYTGETLKELISTNLSNEEEYVPTEMNQDISSIYF